MRQVRFQEFLVLDTLVQFNCYNHIELQTARTGSTMFAREGFGYGLRHLLDAAHIKKTDRPLNKLQLAAVKTWKFPTDYITFTSKNCEVSRKAMTTLNLANFKTVFDVDFTKISSLSGTVFNDQWGSGSNFWFSGANGLLIAGQSSNNYAAAGIEQAPTGASAGEGYGLYQFTGAAALSGQGVGICFVMWRADNVWLDQSNPGLLTELDMLESWDGTKTGQATDHYYNTAASQNGQIFHTISGIDLTQDHTYAMDWEQGSLTYYVDGVELYQITGSTVPKDYAQGGVNYTMGAEVVSETGPVGLYVKDMSYSAPSAQTITLSAPGTVMEATKGAGVTVTETVTTTGLTGPVYVGVVRSNGNVESTSFPAVTLNSNGTATFTIHMASTGDYVVAENATRSPSILVRSSAVTITDPTITLSSPGTVQEASAGAGVTVTETVTTTGLTGPVYVGVVRSNGDVESTSFPAVTLNSSGTATFSIHLANSGDYVVAENATRNPSILVRSAAVTITDPATSSKTSVTSVKENAAVTANVITTTSSKPSFLISGVALDKTGLLVTGAKETGTTATVREFLDGKYVGIVGKSVVDGSFSLHVADVAQGRHELAFTVDGFDKSAVYDFTKIVSSTGSASSITISPHPSSTGSADTLLSSIGSST